MNDHNNEFVQVLRAIGPLRYALIFAVLVSFILRPELGTKLTYEGWHIVTSLLVPVITPILFMLLLLDAIMCMVYRSDKSDQIKSRYLKIVLLNLALAIGLLSYWWPFYKQVQSAI